MDTPTGRRQWAEPARRALCRVMALASLLLLAACAPRPSAPPAESATMLLIQQVRRDLSGYTPPACDLKDTPEQWAIYQQALVRSLSNLLANPESSSLPLPTLEVIFQTASGGWPVRLYPGDSPWVLAALQHGACRYASHYGVGEDVYVFGRSGGEWWVGRVGRIAQIAWMSGEWRLAVDLSASTISGERRFVLWHIAPTSDGWGRVVEFTPNHPEIWRATAWRFEASGRVTARLTRPTTEPPCVFPEEIQSIYAYSTEEVEVSYQWRAQGYEAAGEKTLGRGVYLIGEADGGAEYPLENWQDYCRP